MSLRHAVLGLLSTQPSTGYELTNRFDVSLANAWHASHSQIYPELARLEEAGMVEVVGEGARNSRTFGITPAGRDELRRWLVETEPNRAQRNETAVRWFLVVQPPRVSSMRASRTRSSATCRAGRPRSVRQSLSRSPVNRCS